MPPKHSLSETIGKTIENFEDSHLNFFFDHMSCFASFVAVLELDNAKAKGYQEKKFFFVILANCKDFIIYENEALFSRTFKYSQGCMFETYNLSYLSAMTDCQI